MEYDSTEQWLYYQGSLENPDKSVYVYKMEAKKSLRSAVSKLEIQESKFQFEFMSYGRRLLSQIKDSQAEGMNSPLLNLFVLFRSSTD